jgi:4-hydroxy-2-oxoheptanedioate aldolase
MRLNRVKQLLEAGKPAIGTFLNIPSIATAEIMANVGWDWLVVDAEHGAIDLDTMHNMFVAISTTNTVPMCRVRDNDPSVIKQALDAGAYGIVIPMVNSPEEAERAVKACKYAPEGNRSAGPGRWRYYGGADYQKHANEEILVAIQIEHIDAVNRVEEILSVPGIDIVHMGPGDLAWSMGLGKGLGEKDPAHAEAMAKVLAAAKKLGIHIGTASRSVQEAPVLLEKGYHFLMVMNDINFLYNSASEALKYVKETAGV